MKQFNNNKSPQGFTLIELIVVFSTITFLSIVGIASYRTYSESQSLASSAQELVTTVQLARSRASSQVKPPAPKCKENEALDGYNVEILTNNTQYKLNVVCSGNSYELQTTTLPNNIIFDQDKTTTRKVSFAVITGAVSGNGTIAITGYNQTRYITVDSVGIAHLSVSPPPTPRPFKYVFVTSGSYNGNLKTAGAGTDGLDGGDNICESIADNSTIPSVRGLTWKAWLSTSTVNAVDRIYPPGTENTVYKRLDGAVVTDTKAHLIDGGIDNLIDRDENNVGLASNAYVWTATRPNGTFDSSQTSCSEWQNASRDVTWVGQTGFYVFPSAWTKIGVLACHTSNRLYCFEQ